MYAMYINTYTHTHIRNYTLNLRYERAWQDQGCFSLYVYTHTYTYTYTHIRIHIHTYVCVYTYTYTHTHIRNYTLNIRYERAWQDKGYFFIVMEYCDEGNFFLFFSFFFKTRAIFLSSWSTATKAFFSFSFFLFFKTKAIVSYVFFISLHVYIFLHRRGIE